MSSPSKSQLQAITHGEGPMLVLAGPGSGKTFVMIQRVEHLIHQRRVKPESILVISFSRASALELRERFGRLHQGEPANVYFSTFHACFFHLLKTAYHYTSKDIITPAEQRSLMKTLLSDPLYGETYTREKEEEYLHKFSYYKNKGLKALAEKEEAGVQALFHAYQKEMHSLHKLDFDDMGLLCLQLLKKSPETLARWQSDFSYILIDEFQDINPIQFQIIRLLAEKKENLFVVGDDDQAIYSFRGASPGIMLSFEQYYPKAEKVLLETNFRCSGNIVRQSLNMISHNKERFRKEIRAFHPRKEPVAIKTFPRPKEEYGYLGERVRELREKGVELSGIACIFRTNQNMLPLADYLIRQRIPFRMKEQTASPFGHFIAKDILSYLQFFLEGNRRKDFFVIMNKPLRYLSRNACSEPWISYDQLRRYYQSRPYMQEYIDNLEKQEKWVDRLDLYGAVSYIRKVVGYEEYLKEAVKGKGLPWEEAEEILDFVHQSTRGLTALPQWRQEIEEYEEALKRAKEEGRPGIRLMTMHACKGLEFPYVFLPDVIEGRVPHKRAKTESEIEEERRMFYVAMTRAQERLEILSLEDKYKKKFKPSRFLKGL